MGRSGGRPPGAGAKMVSPDKTYSGINGGDAASDYGWTGAKGERQAYAKAYADSRAKAGDDTDYMKQTGQGGVEYDKARMKQTADDKSASVPSYKKGGKVKATGLALLHKGERVVPKDQVKKVDRAMTGSSKLKKKVVTKRSSKR